jgi:DNA-binding Lrp family transcriptional regulator
MDPLLELLHSNCKLTSSELAERLGRSEGEISDQIRAYEDDGTILGNHAVIDQEKAGNHNVSALIEVKLTPERKGGFDRIARRIAKFDQVSNCYLMSGGYDLAVIVDGQDLREVALFVSQKLSSIEGVISTATHFQLKVYKQSGFLADVEPERERLPVAP